MYTKWAWADKFIILGFYTNINYIVIRNDRMYSYPGVAHAGSATQLGRGGSGKCFDLHLLAFSKTFSRIYVANT